MVRWTSSGKEGAGPGPPIMVELLAVKAGLLLFVESGWSSRGRLILENDCANAFDWIKNPGSCTAVLESLVKDIVSIVLDRNVIVWNIQRSANWETDELAKLGIGITPFKVESLVWRVLQCRVPVRSELRKRGVALPDISFPFCLLFPETIQHLFFSCAVSWKVWGTFFAMWGISTAFPSDPIGYAKSFESWLSPSRGFLKFNVNGAMQVDGSKGGIGGILRDQDGNLIMSFSAPIGSGSSVQAEILAIDFAIKLFMDSRWFKAYRLIVESDCAVVVNWLSNPSTILSEWASLLHPIIASLFQEKNLVNHISRRCNSLADQRAKQASGLASAVVEA
ncbi:hypothetical protein F3Y22_tig00110840pilonHSYRG00213 [Hibiscus syriacus]|uniref:RNase H type-1 domain-containing protein n=1 Tax=Hibiscus syriacus TaxID=106335 RepID=A0A6A2ZL18_HIBSY|nr:hypothetical protein F3Y22_tig00110840pilonHSYRG00213 [Hibiscus syriacus]